MNFTPKFQSRRDVVSKAEDSKNYESVKQYMATELLTFTPEQSIDEVIEIMIDNKISGAPVLDQEGKLLGIISEKDCLAVILDCAYHNQPLSSGTVKDYMTTDIKTVNIQQDVLDVANEFMNSNFRRFPVVENEKVVGQVSRRDILRAAKNIDITTW